MNLKSIFAIIRLNSALSVAVACLLMSAGCYPSQDNIYAAAEWQFKQDEKTLSAQVVTVHESIPAIPPDSPDSCGVNCLDMLLAYEKVAIPLDTARQLRAQAANDRGISINAIVEVMQGAGFKCMRRAGHLRWPAEYTAKGSVAWYRDIDNPLSQLHWRRPVILRIMVRENVYHFILLVGFDEATHRLIVMYPGAGPMIVDADFLLPNWDQAGNVFVAYKPPDRSALSALDSTQSTSVEKRTSDTAMDPSISNLPE